MVMCEVGIPSAFRVSFGSWCLFWGFLLWLSRLSWFLWCRSFVHNLEGEAPGKRLLERPKKISCHRIFLPRQDYARWRVLALVLFSC